MSPAVSLPKARGISFSTPMIHAILAGTKTQTRRLISPHPLASPGTGLPRPVHSPHFGHDGIWRWKRGSPIGVYYAADERRCPYGGPGDLLWVKETWGAVACPQPRHSPSPGDEPIVYAADGGPVVDGGWRSSRHMPRWASRITLEIVGRGAQRLSEISDADVIAEGVRATCIPTFFDRPGTVGTVYEADGEQFGDARTAYAYLWDGINGKRAPSETDPYVWALTFRRLETT